MEWVLLIVLGAAALLGIVKVFFDKPDDLRKLRVWRVGLAISALLFLAAIINFFIHPPLTKEDVKEVLCEWDLYKEKLNELAGKSEISPEEKKKLKESAMCLAKITVSAMDSGLVAIGLEYYDKAITHFNYFIVATQDDSSRAEGYMNRATAYYLWSLSVLDKGDRESAHAHYHQAVTSLDSALIYDPVNHIAWYNRGIALHNLGRHGEAVASYDSALVLKHDLQDAWLNRSASLVAMGRFLEAIKSCDSALAYRPNDAIAWYNRGNALFHMSQYEEATRNYDSALVYRHSFSEAWYCRGASLGRLGQYVSEVTSYDSALKYKHDYHLAWAGRCVALGRLGNYQLAIASCDSALVYKHDFAAAWYNRCNALHKVNRLPEALASCDSALRYDPDLMEAVELRKTILEKMDK